MPSVTLFRHFYVTMSNGDWVCFSLRHGLLKICDGLPTSIKYWNEEFFFVHASNFVVRIFYGATADRVADPSPDLSLEEQSIAGRLSENFVKWVDPKDIMLESTAPMAPSLTKKLLNVEIGNRRPPYSSTMVNLRNLSSKRKGGVEAEKTLSLEVTSTLELKHVEENIPESDNGVFPFDVHPHLDSDNIPLIDLYNIPLINSIKPTSENKPSSVLSAITTVPKSPELSTMSDEDHLDKACSFFMEMMYLLNEFPAHTQIRGEILVNKQIRFEEVYMH
ncbi:unnamed protein product [Lactuca virosa]|uniref:Uncharacterized protein n=1 Tax=Lactuca virosa TaxID=75947 RepID=A0AAU9PNK1_9ASTR|nr:unnamed protein product [Lactuca virosa]